MRAEAGLMRAEAEKREIRLRAELKIAQKDFKNKELSLLAELKDSDADKKAITRDYLKCQGLFHMRGVLGRWSRKKAWLPPAACLRAPDALTEYVEGRRRNEPEGLPGEPRFTWQRGRCWRWT
jgi:hypothetical protein